MFTFKGTHRETTPSKKILAKNIDTRKKKYAKSMDTEIFNNLVNKELQCTYFPLHEVKATKQWIWSFNRI